MPPTVSVAAFVFGIVLLLAALIGKELKVVTVELPALGPGRRIVLGLQFEDPGGIRGGVKFETLESAAGIDIVGVYDAACQPLSTYANVSNPSQPKDHPYNYESMRYQFGEFVYVGDIFYAEGDDTLVVRIQQTAP